MGKLGTHPKPLSEKARDFRRWMLVAHNQAQYELIQPFATFFERLYKGLKSIDQVIREFEAKDSKQTKRSQTSREMKTLKLSLETLLAGVKTAESFFKHIGWLQERFPVAAYGDVTRLCKLASPEEVKEQDYSLNPGRYVGVVIEEDGKTEEEFMEEILGLNQQLEALNQEGHQLEEIICHNVRAIAKPNL